MSAWPALDEVRTFLRLQPDATEDGVISTALAAAVDFGMKLLGGAYVLQPDGVTELWVYTYPPGTADLPDAAHQACVQHAARIYKRRDSIDGTVMGGDLGIVRVGKTDPDVLSLYGIDLPVVFG